MDSRPCNTTMSAIQAYPDILFFEIMSKMISFKDTDILFTSYHCYHRFICHWCSRYYSLFSALRSALSSCASWICCRESSSKKGKVMMLFPPMKSGDALGGSGEPVLVRTAYFTIMSFYSFHTNDSAPNFMGGFRLTMLTIFHVIFLLKYIWLFRVWSESGCHIRKSRFCLFRFLRIELFSYHICISFYSPPYFKFDLWIQFQYVTSEILNILPDSPGRFPHSGNLHTHHKNKPGMKGFVSLLVISVLSSYHSSLLATPGPYYPLLCTFFSVWSANIFAITCFYVCFPMKTDLPFGALCLPALHLFLGDDTYLCPLHIFSSCYHFIFLPSSHIGHILVFMPTNFMRSTPHIFTFNMLQHFLAVFFRVEILIKNFFFFFTFWTPKIWVSGMKTTFFFCHLYFLLLRFYLSPACGADKYLYAFPVCVCHPCNAGQTILIRACTKCKSF